MAGIRGYRTLFADLPPPATREPLPDRWLDVVCATSRCPNRGAWRVLGPGNEKFVCSGCGRRMAVVRVPPDPVDA